MPHRFYTPHALENVGTLSVDSAIVNHGRALRLEQNSPVVLFNGNGFDYSGVWVWQDKRSAVVELHTREPNLTESPIAVHLGVGMALGERMEYSIQKATELGAVSLTPLATQHCELKLKGDRAERKRERWQQVAQSAAEQCGRAIIPHIHPVTTIAAWLQAQPENHLKLVLHPSPKTGLEACTRPTAISALIGPEGGLSEAEIVLAQTHGFQTVCLGPRILRTETAPVVLLSAVQQHWGWD